uniref:DC1 domain-containing protein, putative, expressed n=1 Tax=Oryza sativa subsp. japonica TaxID=39947 RepID=Q2QMP6_ORYSJ|nr:DC1 domain-containing protein, putative, expressed [Oryza sativa Japonica Group]
MRYGEVVHFSHPHHRLRLEHADTPFRCDGCREVGIGARFRCPFAGCDHDLHRQCALPLSPPPPPLRHPFYPRCAFVFLARAPGAPGTRYCNACGRDVAGFVYHCRACGFDLHPCCATLPHVLDAAAGAASGGGGRRREAVPAPEGDGGVPPSWNGVGRHKGGVAGGGNVYDGVTVAGSGGYRVPVIRGAAKSSHASRGGSYWGRKGKVKRCCEIAGFAAQVVISAVLGDPTALIAGVIGSLIAR